MKKLYSSIVLILALCVSVLCSAASLTDYAENKVVDHVFRGVAFSHSSPASFYIALFTVAPSDSTAGTEVTGGDYARVAVTRDTAAWESTDGTTGSASTGTGGTISNAADITFPTAAAAWGDVVAWGIIDTASGAGNLIIHSLLTITRNIQSGDDVKFSAGALTIQLDN